MDFAPFEAALADAVESGRIAGGVALVVEAGGEVYEAAAGVRAAGQPTPMDSATVFAIASMTKAVTSVAALQLVEAGLLALDADLAALLPELANLQVLEGFAGDGAPRLRPATQPVTLRRLLTHTSGFGYGFTDASLARWAQATGAADPTTSGLRAAHVQPLMFEPGEGWLYGIGIDWAGLAIEAATGRRLDAWFSEHIFGPLGMTETGFAPGPELAARHAAAHVRGPDGRLAALPGIQMLPGPEVLAGGAGLHGTARDYGRFLRMLLNGGELEGARVLSADGVRRLAEPQTGAFRAGAIRSAQPQLTHDLDLFPEQHTAWGLAAMINPEPGPAGRGAGSLAWAGIFNTYYWADRDAGLAGVLMTQQLPFADPAVLALLDRLERCAYGRA